MQAFNVLVSALSLLEWWPLIDLSNQIAIFLIRYFVYFVMKDFDLLQLRKVFFPEFRMMRLRALCSLCFSRS